MRMQKGMLAVVTAGLVACHTAGAQSIQTGGADAAPSTGTALTLNVVANGTPTQALQKSDVTLLDNGAAAAVQSLRPLTPATVPTHVILVIDDVNARLSTIAFERDQLKKFFTRDEGKLRAPFAIAVMTDTKTEIQPGFSQNGVEVNQSLQKYQVGLHEITRNSQGGGFDRTAIGINTLQQLVAYARTIPGHKILLFVSPGWPLLSGPRVDLTSKEERSLFATVARLQTAMLASDITLDMVNPFGPGESPLRSDYYEAFLKGVKKPDDVDLADLSLQVLATHNGGTVQQGNSDIAGMVERVMADLDHTYSLTFVPVQSDSASPYHRLQMQVNRPGITVRTPDEYYAPLPASNEAHP